MCSFPRYPIRAERLLGDLVPSPLAHARGRPSGVQCRCAALSKLTLLSAGSSNSNPRPSGSKGPRGSGALRDGLKIWSLARFTTRTARQSSGTAKTMRARRRVMPHVAYICEIWHSAFVKPAIWMGGSREEVKRLPEAVQDSLGFEL
jgi:hypothetical protein